MSSLTNLGKRILPQPILPSLRALRDLARRATNHGNRVECPCCGGKFKRFLPAGWPLRSQARCQDCGARERHRFIWLYLRDNTDILTAPLKVFHSAPESAFLRHLQRAELDYITADIEPGRADLQVDLTDIQIEADTFDVVICNHVLEHIVDDRKAMSELHRILKPGGWAILTIPEDLTREVTFEDAAVTTPGERLRAFGQEDHVRVYGRDFTDRLREAGFLVQEIRYADQFTPEEVRRYGLAQAGNIYRCSK